MLKKKIVAIFCIFSGCLYSEITRLDVEAPEKIIGKEFFLTYPRSGTNLTIGILQYLTRKPLRDTKNNLKLNLNAYNRLKLEIENEKNTLYRLHASLDWQKELLTKLQTKKNKLLFVLRNPKECIVRHCSYSEQQFLKSVIENQGGFAQYLFNLKIFDEWNDRTKLLLYYEDILATPEVVAIKLLEFFDESDDYLESYISNLDEILAGILTSYQKQSVVNKLKYSNKSIVPFHSKNFSRESMRIVDEHIISAYPNLWNKYLKRYQTE